MMASPTTRYRTRPGPCGKIYMYGMVCAHPCGSLPVARSRILVLWVLMIAILLGVGFVGTRIAAVLRLPHSVLLVLVGILGGTGLKWIHAPVSHDWGEAFAEIILYILLPPL